jgi:hypothetical protein
MLYLSAQAWLLVRIEAKLLELPAPFSGRIAQAFNIDAAWETTFDRCLHELRSQERKRERQIDLAHGASLAFRQLIGVGNRTSYDFIEPAASARDGADKTSASFGALRPQIVSEFPVRQEDFAGPL